MDKMVHDTERFDTFQDVIGYRYQDKGKLIQALTHRSYVNELKVRRDVHHNERLEFLGDAVLELAVSDYLFHKYKDKEEGKLTKLRAALVCEPSLAACARELNLGEYLSLGKGEMLTGGRERDSILSDALEAVIGSIYLDGGLEAATKFIRDKVLQQLNDQGLFVDSKSRLQEYVQNLSCGSVAYELIHEEGPDHRKQYTVQVVLEDKRFMIGTGSSKKAAEQEAAAKTLEYLQQK